MKFQKLSHLVLMFIVNKFLHQPSGMPVLHMPTVGSVYDLTISLRLYILLTLFIYSSNQFSMKHQDFSKSYQKSWVEILLKVSYSDPKLFVAFYALCYLFVCFCNPMYASMTF
jgi:hypothetical protein